MTQDTIVAIATPSGSGAIGVVRLSGPQAFEICNSVFKGKNLLKQESHTIHYGFIHADNQIVDEVMVAIFKAPKSFTTEDVIEISCHGSSYILNKVVQLLIEKGARSANPGEFTMRAFLNGRIDLTQAEAVADLIASESEAQQQMALKQMRGGFSEDLKSMRERLLYFASMLELELDFSEEDVEFANRDQLKSLILGIQNYINPLLASFQLGNVLKNGVQIVIAGKPNAGKSTLLNSLLNEEKAIVSEIAGTTRDLIEDQLVIDGIVFRFTDTAGLRESTDVIENLGIQKSYDKIKTAAILLYLFDASQIFDIQGFEAEYNMASDFNIPFILVANKTDIAQNSVLEQLENFGEIQFIAAKSKTGIENLKKALISFVNSHKINTSSTIVSNIRHYEALLKAQKSLLEVISGLENNQATELIALDIKYTLQALAEITGEITNDEILGTIFSKFCIGK